MNFIYDVCSVTGENASTAEMLFEIIGLLFKTDNLSCENCISFGLNNCSTNMGSRNCLKITILKENKNCFIAGCSCNLAHPAVGKGERDDLKENEFDMEEHQVDLLYYFIGSTPRKGILAQYIAFVDMKWCDLTRLVSP